MGKKGDEMLGAPKIQVFELTMDNSEDQDELNQRLQRPGENKKSTTARIARKTRDELASETEEEKSQGN